MVTLTANLFRGTGETDHRLQVVEGAWPHDLDGLMYIVGPDNRRPARHWFAAPGIVCHIACRPDRQRHERSG